MSDYFKRLEAELAGRTEQGAHLDGRVGGQHWRRTLLPVAIGLPIAVAVAAVLLVSVRPHTSSRHPAARLRGVVPGEVIRPLSAVPSLHQLLANFGVLRRAQTALDRSWRPVCGCAGAARQLFGLTRRAVELSNGYRVFLDVEQFTVGGQLNLPAGSYVLNLDIVAPNGNTSGEPYQGGTYTISPLSFDGPGPLARHGGLEATCLLASCPTAYRASRGRSDVRPGVRKRAGAPVPAPTRSPCRWSTMSPRPASQGSGAARRARMQVK